MPFCPECGYEMKADAKFCYRCGAKAAMEQAAPAQAPYQQAPAAGGSAGIAVFQDYLGILQARFRAQPEYSRVLNAYCFRDSQLSAASALSFTKYHFHFFIRYSSGTDAQEISTLSDACLAEVWSLPHHNSLSLNTFAVPVLCMDRGNDAVIRSLDGAIKKKNGFSFSCVSYPTILTLNDGQLHYPAHTPLYGAAVYHSIKKTIGDTLYYRL